MFPLVVPSSTINQRQCALNHSWNHGSETAEVSRLGSAERCAQSQISEPLLFFRVTTLSSTSSPEGSVASFVMAATGSRGLLCKAATYSSGNRIQRS